MCLPWVSINFQQKKKQQILTNYPFQSVLIGHFVRWIFILAKFRSQRNQFERFKWFSWYFYDSNKICYHKTFPSSPLDSTKRWRIRFVLNKMLRDKKYFFFIWCIYIVWFFFGLFPNGSGCWSIISWVSAHSQARECNAICVYLSYGMSDAIHSRWCNFCNVHLNEL